MDLEGKTLKEIVEEFKEKIDNEHSYYMSCLTAGQDCIIHRDYMYHSDDEYETCMNFVSDLLHLLKEEGWEVGEAEVTLEPFKGAIVYWSVAVR